MTAMGCNPLLDATKKAALRQPFLLPVINLPEIFIFYRMYGHFSSQYIVLIHEADT